MKEKLRDEKCVEYWYLGYMTALRVFENSLTDMAELDKKTFTDKEVKEMIDISKKLLSKAYNEEFSERTLN